MVFKLQTPLITISLAVVIGFAIGLLMNGDFGTTAALPQVPEADQSMTAVDAELENFDAAARTAARISELNRLLQNEIRARQALEQKLETLSRQVSALDSAAGLFAVTETADQPDDNPDEPELPEEGWFDQQALLDSGMDNALVSEMKVTFEQLEMERLYLRDRAAREDWDREQMRSEMEALESREDELRERLGESAYDAYLYASGQSNRVAVTSVLASAQAGQAGIKPGDHIVRYDNQRIYNRMDLRSATTSGDISDTVPVEVERDGETLQFYLVRGPLGIRMDSLRVAP